MLNKDLCNFFFFLQNLKQQCKRYNYMYMRNCVYSVCVRIYSVCVCVWQVVRELVKHTQLFRVLALSATPGTDIKVSLLTLYAFTPIYFRVSCS